MKDRDRGGGKGPMGRGRTRDGGEDGCLVEDGRGDRASDVCGEEIGRDGAAELGELGEECSALKERRTGGRGGGREREGDASVEEDTDDGAEANVRVGRCGKGRRRWSRLRGGARGRECEILLLLKMLLHLRVVER